MIFKLIIEHPCVLKYIKQSKYMFKNKISINWALKVQRGFDNVRINRWLRQLSRLIDSNPEVKIIAQSRGIDH